MYKLPASYAGGIKKKLTYEEFQSVNVLEQKWPATFYSVAGILVRHIKWICLR